MQRSAREHRTYVVISTELDVVGNVNKMSEIWSCYEGVGR